MLRQFLDIENPGEGIRQAIRLQALRFVVDPCPFLPGEFILTE